MPWKPNLSLMPLRTRSAILRTVLGLGMTAGAAFDVTAAAELTKPSQQRSAMFRARSQLTVNLTCAGQPHSSRSLGTMSFKPLKRRAPVPRRANTRVSTKTACT